jgi:hypothetical protein
MLNQITFKYPKENSYLPILHEEPDEAFQVNNFTLNVSAYRLGISTVTYITVTNSITTIT